MKKTIEIVTLESITEDSFSSDEEIFGDLDSIHDYLDNFDEGEEVTIYVGNKAPMSHKDYIGCNNITEKMSENAYDHVGEFAEDYPDISSNQEKELSDLILDWFNKNIPQPRFCGVDNIREVIIIIPKGKTNED